MDIKILTGTPLFANMSEKEILSALQCLNVLERSFDRGETVLHSGTATQFCAVLLSGSVNIESSDAWGVTSILDNIAPGQVFAETYACLPDEPLMVNAVATQPSRVLFLELSRIFNSCSASCPHHGTLLRNLITVISRKNLNLTRKVQHCAPRTTRSKLLSYLSDQSLRAGNCRFNIPFNRQQLADYLGVDRSALSAELGKMRRDGLLDFHKNSFFLKIQD